MIFTSTAQTADSKIVLVVLILNSSAWMCFNSIVDTFIQQSKLYFNMIIAKKGNYKLI